jgi:hypothetical protein
VVDAVDASLRECKPDSLGGVNGMMVVQSEKTNRRELSSVSGF